VPVDRKRYCEAMAKVADAYCDIMESMGSVKVPISYGTCKLPTDDQARNSGRTTRAVDAAVEYLKRHRRPSDGICYVVSCSAEVSNIEAVISIKHGLVSEIFGMPFQGTLHVCGSPLYIRHVGNMTHGIKGEPLYVIDHSVQELLAEKT
jgi:hypothetical protein